MNLAAEVFSPGMLARAAEDIRSSAGITQLALDALEDCLDGASTAQQDLLARGKRGLRKLGRVADRLARAARLATPLERARVDLRALIEAGVREAEAVEARAEVFVTITVPDAGFVEADAGALGSAIVEVTGAAIARARRKVDIALVDGPRLLVVDDGVRATPLLMSDWSLALARLALEAHGFHLAIEDPADENGFVHGGRIVVDFRTAA